MTMSEDRKIAPSAVPTLTTRVKLLSDAPRPCAGTRKSGEPCTAFVTASSGYRYCWSHDPAVSRDVKLAAYSKGGAILARSFSRPDAPNPSLQSPADVQAFLEDIGGQVLRGELASRTARTLVSLATAALAAHDANIAQRLAELESLALDRAKRAQGVVVVRNGT